MQFCISASFAVVVCIDPTARSAAAAMARFATSFAKLPAEQFALGLRTAAAADLPANTAVAAIRAATARAAAKCSVLARSLILQYATDAAH